MENIKKNPAGRAMQISIKKENNIWCRPKRLQLAGRLNGKNSAKGMTCEITATGFVSGEYSFSVGATNLINRNEDVSIV